MKLFFAINERVAIILSNEITCVSKSLHQLYESEYKRSFKYIPNGITLPKKENSYTPPYSNYVLFAAGRIIPLKGLHILLKAVQLFNFNKKLIVLGDLNQMPTYKMQIKKISEGLNVEFIGLIREKEKVLGYLKHADLFIFPSYSENMSIMLLEAVSVKVPIIASNIPENTAIFKEDEILYFKSTDVKDLKNKILFALKTPDEMNKRKSSAFKRLITEYTWEKISPRYSDIYKRILNN